MTDKNIFLFGYSGHSLVVADCISSEYNLIGYFDEKENLDNPLNITYHGKENDVNLTDIINSGFVFPSIGSNNIRQKLVAFFRSNQLNETTLIHSSACVSKNNSIGKSSMIGPNATINSNARIGNGVIINSGAIIEHDCIIEDFSHVAPGAILAGNVQIGELSFIGAGAIIKEGVTIGKNVIIGAGSIVLNDVKENEQWVGNPAKQI